jgi:phage protein D
MAALIHQPPAVFFVSMNGIDVSSTFNKYLIHMTIIDSGESMDDTCEIVLDDTGGQLQIPDEQAAIICGIGWQDTGPIHVFEGTVDQPRSLGSRQHGRTLIISAVSADPGSSVKSTQNTHMDQGTLEQAAQKFAQSAGVSVSVKGALGQITRNYWSMGNESFTQWGERIARLFGGTFKVQGNQAVIAPRNDNTSTMIECVVGENVIDWNICPLYNRTQFKNFTASVFNPATATWSDLHAPAAATSGGMSSNATATLNNRFKHSDADMAQKRAASNQAESARLRGGGTIDIIGEPAAIYGATANIVGARPQIDGQYLINKATHSLIRSGNQGYVTRLELVLPTGAPSGGDTGGDGEGQ